MVGIRRQKISFRWIQLKTDQALDGEGFLMALAFGVGALRGVGRKCLLAARAARTP